MNTAAFHNPHCRFPFNSITSSRRSMGEQPSPAISHWLARIAIAIKVPTSPVWIPIPDNSSVCSTPGRISGQSIFACDGPRIVGLTAVGRATVHVLAMNAHDLLLLRLELLKERGDLPA